ncbi:hypothetical protein [Mesorhizobium sp. M8A.F.Ca.ET.165.01.1.1]|uniref:hypothetical protein n=1 Tax=Mesorhizobium sp. M8A.F.Ca.ET.165.01.1.1 TaxID=2563960 RepID=UPI001093A55D|nr:hypothetical protein [Mesorhizobium sp. M8A.F.Ca.ET.165.01.1.1]TGT35922.1 hypothetical protein EN808_30745 [Mesorhizobium sp. M8A.F.Ca.ET.165.01.1.1]
MRFAIQLMIDGGDAAGETQEIIGFDRTDGALLIEELGLTWKKRRRPLLHSRSVLTSAPATQGQANNHRAHVLWQARAAEPTISMLPMSRGTRRCRACRGRST